MLTIVQAITERIREQAGEYAEAQARVGTRTLAGLTDPFGILAAMSGHAPAARAPAGTTLQPPRLKSRRRQRRKPAATAKRPRQNRRRALNFA